MSKISLFLLLALSTCFFEPPAFAQDSIPHECLKGEDANRSEYLIQNAYWLDSFRKGHMDPNSPYASTKGGSEPVCGNTEETLICDAERTVYCTKGVIDLKVKKGDKKDKYHLGECNYAGTYLPYPQKREVIPTKIVMGKGGRPEKVPAYDMGMCAFGNGWNVTSCSYLEVHHDVNSLGQIKDLQENLIDREKKKQLGFLTCRPEEKVEESREDYLNEGIWFDHNHPEMGQTFADHAKTPAPVQPVTPPAPTDPCASLDENSDCNFWFQCQQHIPAPGMQLCSCDYRACSDIIETLAGGFSDLGGGADTSGFFTSNQINSRARDALASIQKYKDVMDNANLSGTYYQNGTPEQCFYERIRGLSDHANSGASCKITSFTPSLDTLANDLRRMTSNENITGFDLTAMKKELEPFETLSVNFKDGTVTTAAVVGKVPDDGNKTVYNATYKLLYALSLLGAKDNTLPFSEIVKDPANAKYFGNRTQGQTPYSASGLKTAVDAYDAATGIPGRHVECVRSPGINNPSDPAFRVFSDGFMNDLRLKKIYTKLDNRCHQDATTSKTTPAGTDKTNGHPNPFPDDGQIR